MRVLVFYDVPGWAWWHKAQALVRHMPEDIVVDALAFGARFDPDAYDFLILFGSYMLDLPCPVPQEKLILGLSNNGPWYVDSVRRPFLEGRVGAVFANSEIGRELLGLDAAFCCQNGVDAEFFCPGPGRDAEFSLGWVGNPNSDVNKGLDLIRAACERTGTPLRTVAHDASRGDTSGIQGHEILREQIYRRAHACVCASEYDGTPNPGLESLACGTPMLTTRVGNMPEVVRHGENGLFVERGVESLAAGIAQLRSMDLATLSRAARQSIEQGWTWPQKTARYEAMLRTLAAQRKAD
ncbi:MAG: glycosyltransferase [Desulfovibrio sp.]